MYIRYFLENVKNFTIFLLRKTTKNKERRDEQQQTTTKRKFNETETSDYSLSTFFRW